MAKFFFIIKVNKFKQFFLLRDIFQSYSELRGIHPDYSTSPIQDQFKGILSVDGSFKFLSNKDLIILPYKTSNHKEEGKENIDH